MLWWSGVWETSIICSLQWHPGTQENSALGGMHCLELWHLEGKYLWSSVLLWLELGAYIEAGYLGAYFGTTDPAVCCLLLPMALGVWSCLLPCTVCLIPFWTKNPLVSWGSSPKQQKINPAERKRKGGRTVRLSQAILGASTSGMLHVGIRCEQLIAALGGGHLTPSAESFQNS